MNHPLRRGALALIFAVAFVALGCHHDSNCLTCMDNRTPTPVAPELSGNWTGTFTESGRTDDFFCPPRQRSETAQIAQNGNDVVITLTNAGFCSHGSQTKLTATLSGTNLTGALASEVVGEHGCALAGGASGTGDLHAIHLTGEMRGSCNDVNVTIDLAR